MAISVLFFWGTRLTRSQSFPHNGRIPCSIDRRLRSAAFARRSFLLKELTETQLFLIHDSCFQSLASGVAVVVLVDFGYSMVLKDAARRFKSRSKEDLGRLKEAFEVQYD